MTNAAFFTESHSPPGPSWTEDKATIVYEALSVTPITLCNPMMLSYISVSHRNLLWCRNVSKTTLRLLLNQQVSFQKDDSSSKLLYYNTLDGLCFHKGEAFSTMRLQR